MALESVVLERKAHTLTIRDDCLQVVVLMWNWGMPTAGFEYVHIPPRTCFDSPALHYCVYTCVLLPHERSRR